LTAKSGGKITVKEIAASERDAEQTALQGGQEMTAAATYRGRIVKNSVVDFLHRQHTTSRPNAMPRRPLRPAQ
jgi:hypothetical protein